MVLQIAKNITRTTAHKEKTTGKLNEKWPLLSVKCSFQKFYSVFQLILSYWLRLTDYIKRSLKLHKSNTLWTSITLICIRLETSRAAPICDVVGLNWKRPKKWPKSKFAWLPLVTWPFHWVNVKTRSCPLTCEEGDRTPSQDKYR